MDDNPRPKDEFETVEFRPADTDRESASIELYHQHLPRLEAAGFIEVDSATDEVTRGEDFEAIRPLLELIENHREELPAGWP